MSFKQRSYQPELLDGQHIPFGDIKRNMQELDFINQYLGGHSITIDGVEFFASGRQLRIMEIGCGGGDNLAAIFKKFAKSGKTILFTGIDINPECIKFASQKYPELKCNWVCNDYANVNFTEHEKPDIIFSSLFCHHFTDEQLVSMLKWQYKNSRLGFFYK